MIVYDSQILTLGINCQYAWNEKEKSILVITGEGRYFNLKDNTLEVFRMALSPYHYDIEKKEHTIVYKNIIELTRLGVISKNTRCLSMHWNKDMLLIANEQNNHYVYLLYIKQYYEIDLSIWKQIANNTYSFSDIQAIERLLMKNILTYRNRRQENLCQCGEIKTYCYCIALSYRCNLDCIYCYEKNLNTKESTSNTFISNIRQAINSHDRSDNIDFVFYGGEPLLATNHTNISSLVQEYATDKRITFRVITNGTLLHEFSNKCPDVYNRIDRYVITLDGPKTIHDMRRKTKSKKGTYSQIIQNVFMLIEQGKTVTIRMNIDSGNFAAAPDFIAELSDMFKDEISIVLYPVTENNENNQNDFMNEILLYRVYQALDTSARKNILFESRFIEYMRKIQAHQTVFINPTTDCNLLSELLITPNGEIYYCNEGMGQPMFKTNVAKSDRRLPFVASSNQCKEQCEFYLLCYGGCPRKRLSFSQTDITQCLKREFYSETINRYLNL